MELISLPMYKFSSDHIYENILISVERHKIIYYISNEVNNNRRRRNNIKIRRDPNHKQKHCFEEASATTRRKLGGDGRTTAGATRSILLDGIWTEIEDTRTVNTNTHDNDETVQVADVINSERKSDEGSNCDMEY